ncbi:hypothetical protein, partial [Methylobrevis pamukkalensis]|uniref:hypothetical protein n=1 Tax=Methylobrevis pamukkalensis TaxID=1439726 RepID=UPI001AED06F5
MSSNLAEIVMGKGRSLPLWSCHARSAALCAFAALSVTSGAFSQDNTAVSSKLMNMPSPRTSIAGSQFNFFSDSGATKALLSAASTGLRRVNAFRARTSRSLS